MKPRRANEQQGPKTRRVYYRQNSATGNIRN